MLMVGENIWKATLANYLVDMFLCSGEPLHYPHLVLTYYLHQNLYMNRNAPDRIIFLYR